MTRFTLTIDCDGAAFGNTPAARNMELSDCVHKVYCKLRSDALTHNDGVIRDTNGNRVVVGKWEISEQPAQSDYERGYAAGRRSGYDEHTSQSRGQDMGQ